MCIYDTVNKTWSAPYRPQQYIDFHDVSATTVGSKAIFAGNGGAVIYDNATDTWTKRNVATIYDMAATSVGTKAIFAGGRTSTVTDAVEIYDAATDTWSTAKLSQGRFDLCATTVGHYAIFAGGQTSTGPSNVVDVYDAETGIWSTAECLAVARSFCHEPAATTVGNQAMIAGGSDSPAFGYGEAVVDIYTLTPEPASMIILALGGAGLLFRRRRLRR